MAERRRGNQLAMIQRDRGIAAFAADEIANQQAERERRRHGRPLRQTELRPALLSRGGPRSEVNDFACLETGRFER